MMAAPVLFGLSSIRRSAMLLVVGLLAHLALMASPLHGLALQAGGLLPVDSAVEAHLAAPGSHAPVALNDADRFDDCGIEWMSVAASSLRLLFGPELLGRQPVLLDFAAPAQRPPYPPRTGWLVNTQSFLQVFRN